MEQSRIKLRVMHCCSVAAWGMLPPGTLLRAKAAHFTPCGGAGACAPAAGESCSLLSTFN